MGAAFHQTHQNIRKVVQSMTANTMHAQTTINDNLDALNMTAELENLSRVLADLEERTDQRQGLSRQCGEIGLPDATAKILREVLSDMLQNQTLNLSCENQRVNTEEVLGAVMDSLVKNVTQQNREILETSLDEASASTVAAVRDTVKDQVDSLKELVRNLTRDSVDNIRAEMLRIRADVQDVTENVTALQEHIHDLRPYGRKDCLESPGCWIRLKFSYDDSWNSCHGDRYVKRLNDTLYVGVSLCNSTRYKMFLAGNPTAGLKNIGDGSGNGEDHCEFIDDQRTVTVDSAAARAPAVPGYWRSRSGQPVQYGTLGGGKYSPRWYECGVALHATHSEQIDSRYSALRVE